jgi:AP-4 complex subunit epsilon-1
LRQIIDHKLPQDYEYHRIPAPWIQIRLLKLLAVLGKDDKTSSEAMYDVLKEVMRRAEGIPQIGNGK